MVAETTDARQTQIQRILDSKAFRTSEVQRQLLQYLADRALAGEGDTVKEYTIGLDVFAKPESFDPRQESSVRMHVARLRQKLADYYRTEGAADTIFVDLPKGGFKLVFEDRGAPEAPVAAEAPAEPTRRAWWLPGAAAVLVLAAGGWLMWGRQTPDEVDSFAATLSADLAELWQPFFDSPRPILVCLATGQDAAVNAGTANGAFFLGQFLTPNRKREVVLTRSDQISMPEIAMDNVVFVGSAAGSRQIESIPMDAQFVMDAKGVRNLKPRSGEPEYFADRLTPGEAEDGVAEETFALISHAPGLYGNGQILLLEGNHTSSVMAAVRAFTDPGLGRMLTGALKGATAGKMPDYYQVVLRVRSMDEMPVDVSYVTHRELRAAK